MSKSTKSKIVCGITMGDPSGIGVEIILKAFSSPAILDLADFLIIGDQGIIERASDLTGLGFDDLRIIDLKNVPGRTFSFGRIKAKNGRASMEYLDEGLKLLKSGKIDCLVTAPISKEAINLAGFDFPGHTEYIANSFAVKDFVMMLLNSKLRVSLVTRHIALKDVAGSLTEEEIFKAIKNTDSGLRSFFALKNPRLLVCGLNPHASDGGLFGDEERRLIIPAIKKASEKGISVSGPFPSDTLFVSAILGEAGAVICMYHDQGLIPLKMSGFDESVNITLGLPFVRTSPGHGTAFDIAGKNKADPKSFIAAIKLAVKCAQNLKKA